MKTFRMIGMALFAVLMCVNLASCSSDDDDEVTEEEVQVEVPEEFTIVGTWKMVEVEGDEMDEWTIILREDGTGHDSWRVGEYSDDYEITYRYDPEKLILYTQVPGESPMAWKIVDIDEKGKEITIQYTYTDEEDGKKYTMKYVFRKL